MRAYRAYHSYTVALARLSVVSEAIPSQGGQGCKPTEVSKVGFLAPERPTEGFRFVEKMTAPIPAALTVRIRSEPLRIWPAKTN